MVIGGLTVELTTTGDWNSYCWVTWGDLLLKGRTGSQYRHKPWEASKWQNTVLRTSNHQTLPTEHSNDWQGPSRCRQQARVKTKAQFLGLKSLWSLTTSSGLEIPPISTQDLLALALTNSYIKPASCSILCSFLAWHRQPHLVSLPINLVWGLLWSVTLWYFLAPNCLNTFR